MNERLITADTDLIPLWVEVCNFLNLEPTELKMPGLGFYPHVTGAHYLPPPVNLIALPNEPARIGVIAHEMAHAALVQSGYGQGDNAQRQAAQDTEQYILSLEMAREDV